MFPLIAKVAHKGELMDVKQVAVAEADGKRMIAAALADSCATEQRSGLGRRRSVDRNARCRRRYRLGRTGMLPPGRRG